MICSNSCKPFSQQTIWCHMRIHTGVTDNIRVFEPVPGSYYCSCWLTVMIYWNTRWNWAIGNEIFTPVFTLPGQVQMPAKWKVYYVELPFSLSLYSFSVMLVPRSQTLLHGQKTKVEFLWFFILPKLKKKLEIKMHNIC